MVPWSCLLCAVPLRTLERDTIRGDRPTGQTRRRRPSLLSDAHVGLPFSSTVARNFPPRVARATGHWARRRGPASLSHGPVSAPPAPAQELVTARAMRGAHSTPYAEGQRRLDMKVQDVMTKGVESCRRSTDLAAAAMIMWRMDCGVVPVVGDDGREAVGMITDRDICVAVATRHRRPEEITVGEVVSGTLYKVRPGDDIRAALEAMRAERVRRLPVVRDG